MSKAILLRERTQRAPLQTRPDYNVIFYGKVWGTVYYNMTGYTGSLPAPDEDGRAIPLTIGERGITAYRREVAALNREWKKFS